MASDPHGNPCLARAILGVVFLSGLIAALSATLPAFAAPKLDRARVANSTVDAEQVPDHVRARELFRLGSSAYRAGRIEEAHQLLSDAWDAHQSYDIAASLGQVELERGNSVRANELLDYCLSHFPPIESDAKLAKMQAARDSARKAVATVEVHCKCDGAVLLVDGKDWDTSPFQRPLYVAPGRHVMAVRSGDDEQQEEVLVVAGQRKRIEFRFPRGRAKESAPPLHPPRHAFKSSEPSSVPYYVGGGLALVGVAAAVGFQLTAASADRRADALQTKLPDQSPSSCSATTAASVSFACAKFRSAVAERHDYARLAAYSYGAAAAVGLATVAYWLLSDDGVESNAVARKLTHEARLPVVGVGYHSHATWLSVSGQF